MNNSIIIHNIYEVPTVCQALLACEPMLNKTNSFLNLEFVDRLMGEKSTNHLSQTV